MMRTVQLVEGINSSAIGFGCAPIKGSISSRKARYAIEMALSFGVTHFDLARCYGYGEAEKFVGEVVKKRRAQVVLASKFGIEANWKARILKPLKPLVRVAREVIADRSHGASQGGTNHRISDSLHTRVQLRGVEMRTSLEKSLQALNTDYLDYFFIHEPVQTLATIEDLADTASRLKQEGKIRAWGITFVRSQKYLHQGYLEKFDVLQFDNSPGAIDYDVTVQERGGDANIIYSPLRSGSSDLSPRQKLEHLYRDFPKSVVLCSMFNEKHLMENIQIAARNYL